MPTAVHRICPACEWPTTGAQVRPVERVLVCDLCGVESPISVLPPLLLVTGASGAGKSTLCRHLVGRVSEAILIDADLLWGVDPAHNDPASGYRAFHGLILHLAERLGANGLPVLIEGTCIPDQYESLGERWYFSNTAYLAVVCNEETLRQRLATRPGWRGAGVDVETMIRVNEEFRTGTFDPVMTILDTTDRTVEECGAELHAWIRAEVAGWPVRADKPA